MELYISLIAIAISLSSVIVSVAIYLIGLRRERKQATLEAFNVLQEQVFDKLNKYTFAQVREVCDSWNKAIQERQEKKMELSAEEQQKRQQDFEEFRILSGYLARIEHFALGVNAGIYDAQIAERAGTSYLVMLYRGKLKPLLDTKHAGKGNTEYYAELRKLVEKIEKIENK